MQWQKPQMCDATKRFPTGRLPPLPNCPSRWCSHCIFLEGVKNHLPCLSVLHIEPFASETRLSPSPASNMQESPSPASNMQESQGRDSYRSRAYRSRAVSPPLVVLKGMTQTAISLSDQVEIPAALSGRPRGHSASQRCVGHDRQRGSSGECERRRWWPMRRSRQRLRVRNFFCKARTLCSVTDDLDRENGSSAVTKSGGSSLSIRVNVGTVTEGVSELEHRKHTCSVYPTFHVSMYQLGGKASRTPLHGASLACL